MLKRVERVGETLAAIFTDEEVAALGLVEGGTVEVHPPVEYAPDDEVLEAYRRTRQTHDAVYRALAASEAADKAAEESNQKLTRDSTSAR